MDPQRLMRTYPWLDHLMAETLLKMHEQGKLHAYLDDWPEAGRGPPASHVIKGAIHVETPQEKCAVTQ
jgi:hypothetical protein